MYSEHLIQSKRNMLVETVVPLAFSLALLFTLTENILALKSLHAEYDWNYLDFAFPTPEHRNRAIECKQFIIGNPFLIDVDVYYGADEPKVFVTMPRYLNGTPITLGTVTSIKTNSGPLISPYPNYKWHNSLNCDGFTSVFRVAIDKCHRLWVIDTGKIGEQQVCPPKIVIFNLKTNMVLFTYKFLPNLFTSESLFINPVVDVRDTCINTMMYLADVTGFAIIVYDLRLNTAWRIENQLFQPEKSNSTLTIAGESFDLMDGIFGISVSPKYSIDRKLFFHPLASISERAVSLSILDDAVIWDKSPNDNPTAFKEIGKRKTQSTVEAIDRNGNQFFGTLSPLGIGCWNTRHSYRKKNLKLVAQSDTDFQFISGLKIIKNKLGNEELWISSCRFQKIALGTRKFNEVNYRIRSILVKDLLNGRTKCNGKTL